MAKKNKKRNRNRKSFIYAIQHSMGNTEARVYRVSRNRPVSLGLMEFEAMFKTIEESRNKVISWLKEKEHIRPYHKLGEDFIIDTV